MSNAQPLNNRTPIINPDGTPTDYFIRWAKQFSGNTLGSAEAAAWEVEGGTGLDGGGPVSSGVTLDLADTAVTPDTYGDATHVAQITVDQQGRITEAAEVAITGGGGESDTNICVPPMNIAVSSNTVSHANWFGRSVVIPRDCNISAVKIFSRSTAPTATLEPAIYASTSAGAAGSLLGNGSIVTGVTAGVMSIPLSSPLAVTAGTVLWIGLVLRVADITVALSTSAGQAGAFFAVAGSSAPSTAPSLTVPTASSTAWATAWLETT